MDKRTSWFLFRAASVVTAATPRAGARFLDAMIGRMVGNRFLVRREAGEWAGQLDRAGSLHRVLWISDLNIGDAVVAQAGISAWRDFFPDAHIDYAIGRAGAPLIEGNPEITTVHPILRGAPCPDPDDIERLESILRSGDYDLVVNLCPFINRKWLCGRARAVVDYAYLVRSLVAGYARPERVNHVGFRVHRFVHTLLRPRFSPVRRVPFRGVELALSSDAVRRAREFLRDRGLRGGLPLVMVNPDALSPFTRLPTETLEMLLRELAQLPGHGLIAAGFSKPGIEDELLGRLEPATRRYWTPTPPSLPIDAFAALVDRCDVYISPDTGQLHMAAARKRDPDGVHRFRNRTAVCGVFGATPVRIYGYDSSRPGFLPANQDAPSRAYDGSPPCRNITCINKRAKSCRDIRCFQGLDLDDLLNDARGFVAVGEPSREREPTR